MTDLLFGVLGVLFIASILVSIYFFYVAQVRSEKDFINYAETPKTSSLYEREQAFLALDKEEITIENLGLKQVAWYVEAEEETHKTVIVAHGFGHGKSSMAAYGTLFRNLGYNVLMVDHMASGESEGHVIGMGWNDRLNIIRWAQEIVERDANAQIVLFGISMGGASVMMASGEETLPSQVFAVIEDSGFSSVWKEIAHQAKAMYNLPAFPILYEVSVISKLVAGFTYGEASTVNQLANNTLPTLFIHGDADNFVPTSMVYENYNATQGEKELYIVPGAKHVKSYETDPETYESRVKSFLEKYESE